MDTVDNHSQYFNYEKTSGCDLRKPIPQLLHAPTPTLLIEDQLAIHVETVIRSYMNPTGILQDWVQSYRNCRIHK